MTYRPTPLFGWFLVVMLWCVVCTLAARAIVHDERSPEAKAAATQLRQQMERVR